MPNFQIQGKNATTGYPHEVEADTTHHGLVITDALHHMIHKGQIFQLSGQFTLAAAATTYFMGVTDTLTVHFQAGEIVSTGSPMTITFYEGATTSANGTQVFGLNKNRNSAGTPTLLTYSGPTVTDPGTELEWGLLSPGSGNAGGQASLFETEWVLVGSTKYLISITNNDAQTATVNYNFLWYEA